MFDRVMIVCAWLAIGLGLAHILYGVVAYKALTPDLIWFAGAGVAMICAGYANLKGPKIIPTLLMLVYFGLTAYVLPLPQVFFGLGLFILMTVGSLKALRQS